jgi:hypothetical protein
MIFFPVLFGALAVFALASGGSRPAPSAVPVDHVAGYRRAGRQGRHVRRWPAASSAQLLVACIRTGRRPSPDLISRALAEAQLAGEVDLVEAIVDTYIRPVVEAAEAQAAWQTQAPTPIPPGYGAYPTTYEAGPVSTTPPPPPSSSYPPSGYPSYPGYATTPESPGASADPLGVSLDAGTSDDDILRMIARLSTPTQASTTDQGSPDPGMTGMPTGQGTVTVSGRSSPIEGVGTSEWGKFCDRVARELPTYTTAHHVGQFRQRRDRLAELGIDPETVVASPEAQRVAFDLDMSHAYQRAQAAGLLSWAGHAVEVPSSDGPPQVAPVTVSGVLGVVQAAGVDGAIGWFRNPEDRRRFGGTTAVFNRTNGVF